MDFTSFLIQILNALQYGLLLRLFGRPLLLVVPLAVVGRRR